MTSRPSGAPLALALAGAGVAAWTTEGVVGVPPAPEGLVALAVAVLLVAASSRWRVLVLPALVALAVVAAQDFLRPGVTLGHDLTPHSWAIYSTWRSVLDGDLWPRWNPYLGLGMPLLQFYSPLPWVASWPAQALGASPLQALASVIVVAQLGTALGGYAALRWLGARSDAALVGVAAVVLAPYHLLDQNFRLALAETVAFAWLLPLLAATWKTAQGGDWRAPWLLGFAAVGLLLTHLLSVVMMTPVLAIVAFAGLRPGGVRRLGFALALAVAVSAAWWLPLVAEIPYTSLGEVAPARASIARLGVEPLEPLRRWQWERYGIRYAIGAKDEPGRGMPLYFGAVLLALLLGTLRARPRLWAALALGTLAAAIYPLAHVLDLPPFPRLQFPWRTYEPATALAGVAVALGLSHRAERAGERPLLVLALVALLAWDASPYLGAAERVPGTAAEGLWSWDGRRCGATDVPPDRFVRVERALLPPSDSRWRVANTRTVFPEYFDPRLRRRYGRRSAKPSRELSESFGVGWRFGAWGSGPRAFKPRGRVSFRAPGGAWAPLMDLPAERLPEAFELQLPPELPAGRLRVAEGWFAGWRVQVDEGPWREARRDDGLLAVEVPAGAAVVRFRYGTQRWDRRLGRLLSALGWLGLTAAALRSRTAR